MPEVSRFFGIIIAMYYNDHAPPHFHAKYGGDQASLRIDNGAILEGSLGTRTLRLVEEWRALHQAELLEDWMRAQARQPLNKIEPLEQVMIPKVVEVKPLEGYKLWLRFQDGSSGTVDLSGELWGPMFEPLKDTALFAQVTIHPELETVTWPNGADLAPEFLYQAAQQRVAGDAQEAARA